MNVPLFNGSGWQATTPSDTGWNGQIAYTTPDIGGFKATLQYQLGATRAGTTSAPTSCTFTVRSRSPAFTSVIS